MTNINEIRISPDSSSSSYPFFVVNFFLRSFLIISTTRLAVVSVCYAHSYAQFIKAKQQMLKERE